jgi:hypothetical protein
MNTEQILNLIAESAVKTNPVGGLGLLVDAPSNFLRLTVDGATTADKCRLATSLECHRDSYGDLRVHRRWMRASLRCSGVLTTLEFPLRVDPDTGRLDDVLVYPSSKEELIATLRHHRPRKPLPFDLEHKAVVLENTVRFTKGYSDEHAEWTDPGRIVSTLNAFLKRLALTPLDTPAGSALLASIDDLFIQNRVTVSWWEQSISYLYSGTDTAPYVSCMKGRPEEWFALYDHMQRNGQLRMIVLERGGEHVGRALVWQGENPDDLYLDRIYAEDYRGGQAPDVITAIKEFCRDHGIRKAVFEQTSERIGLTHVNGLRIKVAGGMGPDDFEYYPYVDSLRYFHYDGWLAMSSRSGVNQICLDDTDGGPNPGNYVTLANGDRVPEDDAVFSSITDESYYRHDATYSEYHDTYIPDEEVVTTVEGHVTYNDNEDLTWLHDGECTLDSDYVELRNGEYAMEADAVELYDGSYVLDGDSDIVELHNGDYALRHVHDIVRLHDGEYAIDDDCYELTPEGYALKDDDGIVEYPEGSGTYYLHDDLPAEAQADAEA